jgi:hypothetical protein
MKNSSNNVFGNRTNKNIRYISPVKKTFMLGLFVTLMASCLKIEEASEIPALEFKDYELHNTNDSLGNPVFGFIMTLAFEDGDGDIGYQEEDTIQSLFMNIYKIEGGEYIDTVKDVGFEIPYVEPIKSVRIVKGEIELEHQLNKKDYKEVDSVQFDLYMLDRAEHKSNTVQSPKIELTAESE